MKTADDAIRELFAKIAHGFSSTLGATRYVNPEYPEEELLINKHAICCGPNVGPVPTGKDTRTGVPFDATVEKVEIHCPENARPEVILDDDPGKASELTSEQLELVLSGGCLVTVVKAPETCGYPVGVWLMNPNMATKSCAMHGCVKELEACSLKEICVTSIDEQIASYIRDIMKHQTDVPIKATVGTMRGGVPVLVMTGSRRTIVLTLVTTEQGFMDTVHLPNGQTLMADAYNPETQQYKRLVVKRMKKLERNNMSVLKNITNPSKKISTQPPEPQAEEPVVDSPAELGEIAKPAVAVPEAEDLSMENVIAIQPEDAEQVLAEVKEAEEAAAKPVAKPAPKPAPAPKQEPDLEVKPDAPVEAAPETTKAEAKKPQRAQKPSKAVGLDIEGFTKEIAAPVDDMEPEQVDKAIDEIRALRDLQLATARRMANITAALYKLSKTAIDKYTQIQQLLKIK